MYVHHCIPGSQRGQKRESKSPNTGVIGNCESPNVGAGNKPVCSEEQQVLLTTETSLQPSYPPTSTYTQMMHGQ